MCSLLSVYLACCNCAQGKGGGEEQYVQSICAKEYQFFLSIPATRVKLAYKEKTRKHVCPVKHQKAHHLVSPRLLFGFVFSACCLCIWVGGGRKKYKLQGCGIRNAVWFQGSVFGPTRGLLTEPIPLAVWL